MQRHARLMRFLLMCFLLIGLNIVATISVYYPLSQAGDTATATHSAVSVRSCVSGEILSGFSLPGPG